MRAIDRALVALLVAGLALGASWELLKQPWGVGMMPRPDALEYAASAQALADSGTFFLQVGPHRVRPRYSPGWPLLLAAAARVGVPPGSLWRISGVFAAALAAAVALLAGEAAARLAAAAPPGPMADRPRRAFWVAASVSGAAWALGPGPVCLGGTLLSDHAAALAAILALVAGAACLIGKGESKALAWAAGLATGAALAIRPVEGALLAVPLALWAGVAIFRRRPGLVGRFGWMSAGAVPVGCLIALVLARSGLDPWRWSDYQLWLPVRFGPGGDVFHWRYALLPDTSYLRGSWEAYSHAGIGARVLLGFEGLPFYHYAGLHWPLAGWAALLVLAMPLRRLLAVPSREVSLVAGGLLLWTFAHFALYSCYFFPAGRFYFAPLAASAVGLGTVCGLASAAGGRGWSVALLGAVLVVASAVRTIPNLRGYREFRPPPEEVNVASKVARWRALDDQQRARRALRFDPVVAQAEGLLPSRVVAGVRAWGKLPPTLHVRRLVEAGLIAPREVAWGRREPRPPVRDPKAPRGERVGR